MDDRHLSTPTHPSLAIAWRHRFNRLVAAQASTQPVDNREAPTGASEAAPDVAATPDVFIWDSRVDEAFVRRLEGALRMRGKDVWIDWEDIPATANWRTRIFAGIDASRTFVAVLSPDLVESEICGEEIEHATQSNKRLIPILRRDVDRQGTPEALLVPNWIVFRDGDDFDDSVNRLVEALETDLEWLTRTPGRSSVRASGTSPAA